MGPSAELATKPAARIALIGVPEPAAATLAECFKQFRIQSMALGEDALFRITREKFEGCVLRLTDDSRDMLRAIRGSASNRSMVLYAVGDPRTAMQYSEFGINAVIHEPVERSEALKMVRATYLLAVHEFRRYVRVPVAIAVGLEGEGKKFEALSQEISSGGMSLQAISAPPEVRSVTAAFNLPGGKHTTVRGQVCWRREGQQTFGVRFEATDPGRAAVRDWIEGFLDQH